MELLEKVCRTALHANDIYSAGAEPRLLVIGDLEDFPAMMEGEFIRVLAEGAVHDDPVSLGKSVHRVLHARGKANGVEGVLLQGTRPSLLA
jgi:hypothetical protein